MRRILTSFVSLIIGSLAAGAAGQSSESPAWDPVELLGFVDGVMEAQQKAQHFAGAVVVVVVDGRIVLQKGYGYADYAERKPVDPERTLFRIASNSKMFVWTAVMQLVEEGKLDLRADVNRYLKGVRVPATFPEPVTLEHLMTHTAGFEDRFVGLFAESPSAMRPLAELMTTQMPRRVFPPGQVAAYSNYGTTLAALIVEQASGLPYERYLNERILAPLEMTHATLSQPLPPELAADMSKGYEWTDGRLKEHTFEYVPWGPCGGMSASGAAMARFMMAHLNDGALGESSILRPETAREMRARLASPYSTTSGMLHGFFPMDWNGEKIYGHGGDTVWFHSMTAMLPERRAGVFVAYNTNSGSRSRSEFAPAFFDHYFPAPLPKEPPAPRNRSRELRRFAGVYFGARSSFSDVTMIGRLMAAQQVRVEPEGYLAIRGGGETTRWREIDPLVFQQVNGKRRIVFRQDAGGRITDFCSAPLCVVTMQKQPWWETPGAQWGALGGCLALLLGGLITIPVAAFIHRKERRPGSSKATSLAAWLTSLLWGAGFVVFVSKMEEAQRVVFGMTAGLKLILGIWLAAASLTLGLLALLIRGWLQGRWRTASRIGYTLIALGALGCILWLRHWNLLAWGV